MLIYILEQIDSIYLFAGADFSSLLEKFASIRNVAGWS